MNHNEKNRSEIKEVTLRDLILLVRSFFYEIVRYWIFVGVLILLALGYFLYSAYHTPDQYSGKITFTINNKETSSGVGSVLGQFGLGGSSRENNLNKISEFSKSRKIIQQALFKKTEVDGKNDYYANHIIAIHKLDDLWKEKNPKLGGFRFKHDRFTEFSRLENKALLNTYSKVKGNKERGVEGLMEIVYSEETGILEMMIKSYNEELSSSFVETLYEELSKFYIAENIEKPRQTYTNLKSKVDSLANSLEYIDLQLAKTNDQNRGLFNLTSRLKADRLARQQKILGLAFGKAIENLEVADFTLKNATPFFQVIDAPLMPITPTKESYFKAVMLGILLGGFIGSMLVIIRKIINDALEDNNSDS